MFKQHTRRYQLEKRIHFPDSLYFFIFLYIYIFFIFISFRGDSERTDTGSRGKRHSAGHNPRAPAVAAMVMARGLSQSC